MKLYIYALLAFSVLLWFTHWEVGYLHSAVLCHNGKFLCSLFVIKVACELMGLLSSLMMLRCVYKLWAAVLLSIFALSLAIDIVIRIYSSNSEDDHTPKAMIIFPGSFTIEGS